MTRSDGDRDMRHAWKRLLAATLMFAGTASPVAADRAPGGAGLPAGSSYVSLGSSYAAGAGIGPTAANSPGHCNQSVNNYPRLVAARLGLTLVDASCGGATTAHLLRPWRELPAQLDSVTPTARLVTVTIGGNDVHLVGDLAASECRKTDGSNVPRCVLPPAPTEAEWGDLERNLHEIAREVRRRAPDARLVFVDYLNMLPRGAPCAAVPFDRAGIARARATFRHLAEVTARVARNEHALLIPAGKLSTGHDACSAAPWAVGRTPSGAPWHPTAAGHAAIARELTRVLRT